ncbi:tRNA glutamyl-Q(34) synthetase GluQRS [Dinoroseobacter sp. S375]|uniref:tRNA glutamyl-Q(34) synthetase GluQRS n=1 Tax=Dinoroseobacter sp. S375 TaxID=3415136 RepID=UPI003C7A6C26
MKTRFAPSPTGPLHLGHGFSACTAAEMAEAAGGTFLLRIEDIDQSRARPEWEALIYEDLAWLGLAWPSPVMRQSERQASYDAALDRLWSDGLLYPCTCTRRDIAEATRAPQEGAPLLGPDGVIYPGTCRGRSRKGPRPVGAVLRLDMAAAVARCAPDALRFVETGAGLAGEQGEITLAPHGLVDRVGDVVLCRRDMATSYHLSVVVDDAAQEITHVVRGRDLFEATAIHVVLQALLGLPVPAYHHHRLIRDAAGKRLAKRDDARALSAYRDAGLSVSEVRALWSDPQG